MSGVFCFIWTTAVGAAAGAALGVLMAFGFMAWMIDRIEKSTSKLEETVNFLNQEPKK